MPSPSVWAPGAALAALQAQLVPRTVWSRLLQRAHHYHRRRAVAWAETLGGAGSGGHLAACGVASQFSAWKGQSHSKGQKRRIRKKVTHQNPSVGGRDIL